jgi:hypothetical protein
VKALQQGRDVQVGAVCSQGGGVNMQQALLGKSNALQNASCWWV